MAGPTKRGIEEIQGLDEAEQLVIPEDAILPENLAEIWARNAATKLKQDLDEFNLEMSEDFHGIRHFTRDDPDGKKAEQKEEEQRRREIYLQKLEQFQETMDDVRERSDRLLERIDREERIARKRLQEDEEKAIRLRDGRRVYVGAKGQYVDEQGRELKGRDRDEARQRQQQSPDATTWAQRKEDAERYENDERMREQVQRFKEKAAAENGKGLSERELGATAKEEETGIAEYEAKFNDYEAHLPQGDTLDKRLSTADYSAYETPDPQRTSYAGTVDGKPGSALGDHFTPAASGKGAAAPDDSDSATRPRPQLPGASPNPPAH